MNQNSQSGNISPLSLIISLILTITLSSIGTYLFLNSQIRIQTTPTETPLSPPTPASGVAVDPTADWNTYTNDRFKFSLRVPSRTEISDFENGSSFSIEPIEASPNMDPHTQLSKLFVKISLINPQKTFQDNINNYIEGLRLIEENFKYKQEDIVINGLEAVKLSYFSGVSNEDTEDYFFNQDNKTFHLSYSLKNRLEKQEKENYKNMLNQILSTFKFTS